MMKKLIYPVSAAALLAAGCAGLFGGVAWLGRHGVLYIVVGAIMLADLCIKATFYKPGRAWKQESSKPVKLSFGALDYLKGVLCWMYAYKHTYVLEPGLYYLGEKYDAGAPLLVTANYHLTVLHLYEKVKRLNVRLLVIDTDGINVWCSAGKGRFSAAEIGKQLGRYGSEVLGGAGNLEIVLPKFAMSGVSLKELRGMGVKPVIGPLYAADVPAYLSAAPLKDRVDDKVNFGIGMRTFAWLPGMVQYVSYFVPIAVVLSLAGFSVSFFMLIGLPFIISTAYPLLFPYLPGKKFAVKGLWLGVFVSVVVCAMIAATGGVDVRRMGVYVLFSLATSLFEGLSFTGNSAVSNYSRVRVEIARYLPVNVALYVACLVLSLIRG